MSLSIESFAKRFTLLLAITAGGALVAGAWLVIDRHILAESRFVAESKARLAGTARLISTRIDFYRRILADLSNDPRLASMIEVSAEAEIVNRAERATSSVTGSLGAALARPDGRIIGNPPAWQVGEICIRDLRHRSTGDGSHADLAVHRGIPGLEHIDLYQKIPTSSGEPAGILAISVQLDPLKRLLGENLGPGNRYRLLAEDGRPIVQIGHKTRLDRLRVFRQTVGGTGWTLELIRPHEQPWAFSALLALIVLVVLAAMAAGILYLNHAVLGGFGEDLRQLHRALLEAGNDDAQSASRPPVLVETGLLLTEVDNLADRLRVREGLSTDELHRDPLTGLYDRRYFEVLLVQEQLQPGDRQLPWLALIELNDFGQINERYGHASGDALLQAVARFLLRRVRKSDTVARLTGIRFALLLRDMDAGAVDAWLRHLATAFARLEQPQTHGDGEALLCTLAIGAAALDGRAGQSAQDPLEHAGRALQTAKQRKQEGSVVVLGPAPEAERLTGS